MKKKKLTSLVLVAALLVPVAAQATDPLLTATVSPTTTSEPPPFISPLKKGQAAPISGVLFSPEAVAKVVAQQDSTKQAQANAVKHQADVDAAQQKYHVDQVTTACDADKKTLQAQLDDEKRQVTALDAQLKKTATAPSASTWFGLGVGGGVIATIATVFLIGRATH